jgi:hypothetical protein
MSDLRYPPERLRGLRRGGPGRPPGSAGLARALREKFGEDLERLVSHVEKLLNDAETPPMAKVQLISWVADRTVGRVESKLDVDVLSVSVTQDLTQLTDEELADIKRIAQGAAARAALPPYAGGVIDVEPENTGPEPLDRGATTPPVMLAGRR